MSYQIGLDIDGVLVNTPFALCKYISERLPIKLTIDDLKTYWVEDLLPDQYKWIVDSAFNDSTFWKSVEMIPSAAFWVEQLYNDGHELWFVTSSLPKNLRKKINHLARNLDFLPEGYIKEHTINIQRKQLLKLDFLIDDAPFNITGDRDYYSICMAYPYNEGVENEPRVTRVYSWGGAYNAINSLQLGDNS